MQLRRYEIKRNGEPFIDGTKSKQFRIAFDVEVRPAFSQVKLELLIYNLKSDAGLVQNDTIELSAGYGTELGQIFIGTITNIFRERDGADTFHRVICRTATSEQRGSISQTLGEGTTIIDALRHIARAFPARLDVREEQFKDAPKFTSGRILEGDVIAVLDSLKQEYAFDWVEDKGRLVIMKIGDIEIDTTPIEISQYTGMEGIPEVGLGPLGLGVTVKKRLDPFIALNSLIEVKTGFSTFNTGNVYYVETPQDVSANGVFNVLSLNHKGDTTTDEWTTTIDALRKGILQTGDGSLVWGQKVTQEFAAKVREIADLLQTDPNWLMAVMAFETGATFSPYVKNAAGSGATGLIQFMPNTAKGLGTSTEKLARMSAVEQLDYVYKYYQPYKGRMKSLSDTYLAVLYPVAVGKPDGYILFSAPSIAYVQNSGLDTSTPKKGYVTKGDAARRVEQMMLQGQKHSKW